MKRKEKIRLLQSIYEGKRMASSLKHGKYYFITHYLKHDVFSVATAEVGKQPQIMTAKELEVFRKELEEHNRQMIPSQQIRNAIYWIDNEQGNPFKQTDYE